MGHSHPIICKATTTVTKSFVSYEVPKLFLTIDRGSLVFFFSFFLKQDRKILVSMASS